MKLKSIILLAALAVMTAACGSDEPETNQAGTMMDDSHGKTVLAGTDIYFDSEGRLVSEGGKFSISLCRFTELKLADPLQVNVSLNKRMKLAAGNVYAIVDIEREHSFYSGKVAVEAGTPITYIKVTELIKDDGRTTGFRYESKSATVGRGSLPAWDTSYYCQKMDEDSWALTLELSYLAYEVACFDDLYTVKTTNAQNNNLFVQINHRYVKEDHSDDYEGRLLVTYTLDNYIYLRTGSYGGVCVRLHVHE